MTFFCGGTRTSIVSSRVFFALSLSWLEFGTNLYYCSSSLAVVDGLYRVPV